MKIKADIGTLDILIHLILWAVISIFTFGIGAMLYPYYFCRFIINRTSIEEDGKVKRFDCKINIFSNILNMLIWFVITILTLGIGYIFFIYKVWNYSLNMTDVIEE